MKTNSATELWSLKNKISNLDEFLIPDNFKRSHKYLTDNFFSPKRPITRDEWWLYILSNIDQLGTDNPFLGGFITNACYRCFENQSERSNLFSYLYAIKKEYDENAVFTEPVHARWFVSSSYTLAISALLNNNESEAELILSRFQSKIIEIPYTPLYVFNLSFIYFLFALFFFKKSNLKKSHAFFEKALITAQNGMNEIFHVRNEFLYSMLFDCQMLLDVSRESLHGIECLGNEYKGLGSRVSKIKSNKAKLSCAVLYKRFDGLTNNNKKWFKNLEVKFNNQNNDISGVGSED